MDLATIIGLVLAWGAVLYSMFHASHGAMGAYLKPAEIFLVFGGSIGAALLSMPMHNLTGAVGFIKKWLFNKEAHVDHLIKSKNSALVAVLNVEAIEDAGGKDWPAWKPAAMEAAHEQIILAVVQSASDLIAAQNAADDARQRIDAATKAKDQPAADKASKELKTANDNIEKGQRALAAATANLLNPPTTTFKARATDDYPDKSTGRRAAFARWLTDAKNPLTARVAVNHLWTRHFAQGLVPSVDDFGRNGRPATHPALVDWLASELVANGWRMKPIHRLIVTSATYRMASTPHESNLRIDPDDTWLWRFPGKRMEAELVRDNVLYASGKLDCSPGGPEIDQNQGLTSTRRSLYFRIAPEKEVEFLKIFDGPNPNECYFRRPSVMPQQALALANSQLVLEQSKVLERKLGDRSNVDEFIRAAFARILARQATAEELVACREFLVNSKSPQDRAREELIVVLFNHNDFVTVR